MAKPDTPAVQGAWGWGGSTRGGAPVSDDASHERMLEMTGSIIDRLTRGKQAEEREVEAKEVRPTVRLVRMPVLRKRRHKTLPPNAA